MDIERVNLLCLPWAVLEEIQILIKREWVKMFKTDSVQENL